MTSSNRTRHARAACFEPLENRTLLSAATFQPVVAPMGIRATPQKHVRAPVATGLNKHGHHVHVKHKRHHKKAAVTPPAPKPTPKPTPTPPPVVVVTPPPPPPPPPTLAVGANVDTTRTAGNEMEAQVAINPTNPNNLVMVAQNDVNGGESINISRSFDGGRNWVTMTWGGAQDGFGNTPRPDARVTFDAFGNCYVAYLVAVSKTQIDVIVITSDDGGASFGSPMVAVGSSKIDPDDPCITTGPSATNPGRQAVWVSFTDGKQHRIMVVGGTSAGPGNFSGWGSAKTVSTAGGSYSSAAVGPDGELAVAWQSGEFGQGANEILFNADPTGTGNGFGDDVDVTTTNVGGFDYIPAQPGRSIDAEVKLAFDRSGGKTTGRLYLAYVSEVGDESNNTDIMLMSSDDLGGSWSGQVRVNDDKTATSQFLPALAVDQTTGVVGLSWMDSRNSGNNTTAQLFSTVSLDHGKTFVANVRVSAGTSNQANADGGSNDLDYGDKGGLAFHAGRLVPVWSDNSGAVAGNPDGGNSDFDILTAVITVNA